MHYVADEVCNKTVCNKCEINSLSVFMFQDEIQFSSNAITEQFKYRDSGSCCGCNVSWFYKVLHHITCMTDLC